MARRPLTWSEALVGRRCPPDAKYLDLLMAGFVDKTGAACGRAEPSEQWLRPAHAQARKKGWIRLRERWSVMGGRAFGIYVPTEAGLMEAKAAQERVARARSQREAWARELQVKLAARKVQRADDPPDQESQPDPFSEMDSPDV